MHPIERLRYVARSSGAPQDVLVHETATALASFRDDPVALVTACRRIVSRQLTSGPLWWLCSRMLCASDPLVEARSAVAEIAADPTGSRLAAALPQGARVAVLGWPPALSDALARRGDLEVFVVDAVGEGSAFAHHLRSRDVDAIDVPLGGLGAAVLESDLLLVETSAASTRAFASVAGVRAAACVARHADRPVWLVAGVGRVLPDRVWEALTSRLDVDEPWNADEEIVPIDLVTHVVGPDGLADAASLSRQIDCPIAPELFKHDIT